MSLLDFIFGRPLASDEDSRQKLGSSRGVSVFGLDALSSAAYGPEAALTILIPAGMAGLRYIVPISTAIIALLIIVYFSYRQTIAAYPKGGGSYTVASENLGARAGLIAAAALLIDYMLNVADGISAGVGALVSAIPTFQPYTLDLCLVILILLSVLNLRGLREASFVFMIPTYLFVGCLLTVLVIGVMRVLLRGGALEASSAESLQAASAGGAVGTWLLLKAFASGCTALTGVEAVSNGVPVFREPVVSSARRTLTIIVAILIALLIGIAFLTNTFHIMATPPGQAGYQSILSQLTKTVVGNGFFYYVTMASVLIILCFSANTSFADFPRVCRVVAADGYLPRSFANRGRRLVYSEGIIVLTILSGILLWIFDGVTDRLIPLFAIGAFTAFTLSQAGMVGHWKRQRQQVSKWNLIINGLGALATFATVCIVLAAKFMEGAWITVVIMILLVLLMTAVRRHYVRNLREVSTGASLQIQDAPPPIVVVPIDSWSRVSQKALAVALSVSSDVQAVHVQSEEDARSNGRNQLLENWHSRVEQPAHNSGKPVPKLVLLSSPYCFVVQPIVDHVVALEQQNKGRIIAVVIPQLVEPHWYNYFLHNQRGQLLAALLVLKGDRRIVTINVPWYLKE
jgi:amino acid transporter